jgi:hypothetical protein
LAAGVCGIAVGGIGGIGVVVGDADGPGDSAGDGAGMVSAGVGVGVGSIGPGDASGPLSALACNPLTATTKTAARTAAAAPS